MNPILVIAIIVFGILAFLFFLIWKLGGKLADIVSDDEEVDSFYCPYVHYLYTCMDRDICNTCEKNPLNHEIKNKIKNN